MAVVILCNFATMQSYNHMIHGSEVSAIVIVGQDRNKTNISCVHVVALRQRC